jgi:DNA-binding response OmpR family regulator
MKVLVVDDSRPMRMFIRRALETAGHEVAEAADGAIALRVAREFEPHLALLDWNMPEVDGITCLQMLKARYGSSVKAVLTTAEADSVRMDEAIENGADGYLVKPFSADELITLVTRTLS